MLEHTSIQRLLDIALLGCLNGHVGLSRQVIEGLDEVLENSPELEICRAMSFYTVDQFEPAMAVLETAEKAFPGNLMVKTHKGLTQALMGDKDTARRTLNEVLGAADNSDAAELARTLLDEAC